MLYKVGLQAAHCLLKGSVVCFVWMKCSDPFCEFFAVASSSSQHDLTKDCQMLRDCKITTGKRWKPRPDYDELWNLIFGQDAFKPVPLRREPIEFKPLPIKSKPTDVDITDIIMKQIAKTCLKKRNEFQRKQSQLEPKLPDMHGRVFTRTEDADSEESLESVL